MRKVTVKIGTQFRYSIADGNPMWVVTQARGRGAWICEVMPDEPDYAGSQKCFSTEEIQRAIGMENFWKVRRDASDDFYASLRVGDIIHYSNGFGSFVRCTVTQDKKLLPVALVGKWQTYDLPHRNPNGSITLGYHAEKIKKREPIAPHASNLYEYSTDLKKFENPAKLPPIDLTVPEMTSEQAEHAEKIWKLQAIRKIVEDNFNTPDNAFKQILVLLS